MITKQEISRELTLSELSVAKVIQGAWTLFSEKWVGYLLLTLIVFFPSTLAVQYAAAKVSPETMELRELMKLYGTVMLTSCIWIIGTLVTAVMVNGQLWEERIPFGTAFYRGVRAWPKAVATVILLLLLLMAVSVAGMLAVMIIPLLTVPFITALLIGSAVFSLGLYFAAITAAIRRKLLMDNLRYVGYLLRGHIGKSIGLFLLLFLGSALVSYGAGMLADPALARIADGTVRWIVQSLVNSLLSVTNIFMFIALSLYFFNLEFLKLEEEASKAGIGRLPE